MSTQLDKVELVKGPKWERKDPLDNIEVSTYNLIKDAIKVGKKELAKDLADYAYFWEIKVSRDLNVNLNWGFPEFIRVNYGEFQEIEDLKESMIRFRQWHLPFTEKPTIKKRDLTPYEYTMEYGWRMLKGHRMGKNDGADGYIIEEYPDRYEFVWDPCYTGGRPQRGDSISGTPPWTGPPYNYSGNVAPHWWTFGKTGVPGYCSHCAWIHNRADADQRGYFNWVTGYPEHPFESCRYIAYKDVDWIPEEYYTRVGKTKPKVTSTKAKPKNVNKLIKVISSDELGSGWIPTLNMLKAAIDGRNKEKALELVDILRVEQAPRSAAGWNWAWMDMIADKYGYNELYHALRWIYSPYNSPPAPNEPRPTKATIPSAEERARKGALLGRSSGSGGAGSEVACSVRIVDELDRIVMHMEPCGMSGRSLMKIDKLDKVTEAAGKYLQREKTFLRGPMTGPPLNFGVTKVAHAVGWGKVGIPMYCTWCCVQVETAGLARTGYLTEIIERPENATDPNCRWLFYKDLDDIPEKYYTRIGAKKPPRQRSKR
ncbi:hypothetical protein ACFLT8_06230 [Chloroflexota bacterium]